jgi:maleate isomerase
VRSLGVITPHAAAGPEAEWPLIAGRQIVTRVARIPAPGASEAAPGTPPTSPAGLRTLADPSVLVDAAASFGGPGSVDAIGLASTSMGYVIGRPAESARLEELSLRFDVPVDGTSAAAVTALRVMDIERLELVHPRWFDEEMNELGCTYFQSEGFDVVASTSAEYRTIPIRSRQTRWSRGSRGTSVTSPRACSSAGRVSRRSCRRAEQHVGRPVLSSNQVLLWSLLGKLHVRTAVSGYGSLFQH